MFNVSESINGIRNSTISLIEFNLQMRNIDMETVYQNQHFLGTYFIN